MAANSQAHLDTLAQQMGFRDYATYSAYQRTRNGIIGAGTDGATGLAQPGGAPPQNWLQHLLSSVPGTPAYLFDKINEKLGKALGN